MALKKILDLCEKQGFIKRLFTGSTNKSNGNEVLKFGPTGNLLQENLKTEWFYSMVINRDNSVFLSRGSFADTYEYAKEICQERLPYGVAEIVEDERANKDDHANKDDCANESTGQSGKAAKVFDFDKYCLEDKKFLLRTTMFVAPTSATQFFHQWQRQRRMWWRKFSASPGRYSLTDIQNNGVNSQSVEIKATYPWDLQLIESLMLSNAEHDGLDKDNLQARDGRKKVQAHYISSEISLSSMVLNTLCDAYEEPLFQGEPRPLLRLHRKLAPYKISFSVTATQSAMTEELGQLALYLCKKLRTNHISSLLVPSAVKNTLEAQWLHYDQLGVPYTVVLNENTLKTGIALLRSRDTTLKEQVHVSNLPTYVEQLFKNY